MNTAFASRQPHAMRASRHQLCLVSQIANDLNDMTCIMLAISNSLTKAQEVTQPLRTEPFIPPRTQTEQILAEIWSAALKLDDIGVRDDFFAFGGHSLMATRVISAIRAAFNVNLPLRALFESPTIELLARRIDMPSAATADLPQRGWTSLGDNLSRLGSGNADSGTVVLIPGAGGSADVFLELARKLVAQDVDVLVVHHDGVDNENEPLAGIPAMADRYAAQLRRHCRGTPVIAGYCLGGVIAWEVAKRLHGNGMQTAGLTFIDTMPFSLFGELPAPDLEYRKCEFFRAICASYAGAGAPADDAFDGLALDECVEIAVAAMALPSLQERANWADIFRRRFNAEMAHMRATYDYGSQQWRRAASGQTDIAPAALSCRLSVVQTTEMSSEPRATGARWRLAGFDDITVDTIDGSHLGVLRDHADRIAASLLTCVATEKTEKAAA